MENQQTVAGGGPRDPFAAHWLRDVPPAVTEKLRSASKTISMPDRGVIYGVGARQEWLWGVASGQVCVHVALNEMEPIVGHFHQQGAWFGESEPLLGLPGLVEMQARGETNLVRVDFSTYRSMAFEHPELWEALARLTSMNQLLAMTAANDLALRKGHMRIAAVLLRLSGYRADLQQTLKSPTVPAKQRDIARLANVSPAKLSEELKRLGEQGVVRLEYGRVVIVDAEALERVIAP